LEFPLLVPEMPAEQVRRNPVQPGARVWPFELVASPTGKCRREGLGGELIGDRVGEPSPEIAADRLEVTVKIASKAIGSVSDAAMASASLQVLDITPLLPNRDLKVHERTADLGKAARASRHVRVARFSSTDRSSALAPRVAQARGGGGR
jgi:hypothetical protein